MQLDICDGGKPPDGTKAMYRLHVPECKRVRTFTKCSEIKRFVAMFDNCIQVVPLFGEFLVKTKVRWHSHPECIAFSDQCLQDLKYNSHFIVSPI